jgi:TolB protein
VSTRERGRGSRAVIAATAAVTLATGAGASRATPPGTNGRIAFQRYVFQDKPLQADIFAEVADGSSERRITKAPRGMIDDQPDWSPDGKQVAFQRGPSVDGPWTLWIANANGSGTRKLSPLHGRCLDESSPAFSPNGKQIAFECHNHTRGRELFSIVVMSETGGRRHVVVRGSSAAGVGRPQFSPDGTRLVFERQNINALPKDGHATFVVNVDGTRLHRVTPWRLRAGDHPDWSPDGKLILVRSDANGPDFGHQGNLFVVPPNGSGLRQLTHFRATTSLLQNGSFSPDGRSIVFATTDGATRTAHSDLPDVFTMGIHGTSLRPVTRERNWDGSPDWGR